MAASADISPNTIARLEHRENIRGATIASIRGALESAGVEFIPENGGGPGVRLRQRATAEASPERSTEGESGIIDNNEM
ncbi:hypothetical protein GCM10007937_10990 [Mesorhizobium albiziae]|nr:transcriptional regulator [Mesorhizobium albiziae]GLS29391.1 hypothetical protein GCM10007937_10990 [Mesorhizobium albiziae]